MRFRPPSNICRFALSIRSTSSDSARAGCVEQLTRDHTVVQEQIELGWLTPEAAREAANRSILTRAVGSESRVETDLASYHTAIGDTYLLCSDGLTEMVTDREIGEILRRLEGRIEDAAASLVQKANERGGVDNISVVLVRVTGGDDQQTGESS